MSDQINQKNIIQFFGIHLKKIIKEKCMTQNDLVRRSGLSLHMISDIERGIRQPGLITLFKLSKGLNITIVELFESFSVKIDCLLTGRTR